MTGHISFPEDKTIKDRRKRKTQCAVESALLELLREKAVESISISELAEKADINRKTFYNNYNSIEDVLHGIDRKVSAYFQEKLPAHITIENEGEIFPILLEMAESMEPYKELLYRITSNRGSILIMQRFQFILKPYIDRSFEAYEISPVLTAYINRYITNGLSSLFFEWFQNDNLTSGQLATLAFNMTISAIHLENYNQIL